MQFLWITGKKMERADWVGFLNWIQQDLVYLLIWPELLMDPFIIIIIINYYYYRH